MKGLLIALLLAGAADELATTKIDALTLKAPPAWKRTVNEGTTRFAAPSGEAYFEVDVGRVQTAGMTGEVCLGKILAGLGEQGFTRQTLGGSPAAVKSETMKDADGKEFRTLAYVGCDGRTTWSLMFHLVSGKQDRFVPLAEKIVKSIQYGGDR